MSQLGYSAFDSLPAEAHGDVSTLISEIDLLNDLGLDSISDGFLLDVQVSGTCYLPPSDQLMNAVEPNELDQYIIPVSSQAPSTEIDHKRALINNLSREISGKGKRCRPQKGLIALSRSAGVAAPQRIVSASSKIRIVHPLEETFRPRYKSDYFAQNGKNRKPRYVADRVGNHFITIQVPVGIRGRLLVHWLTVPNKSGDRYLMPYRFQQCNASTNLPDCNPYWMDIDTDKHGIMKLYLVLIKSKQDELKHLQPLQSFQPWKDAFNIPAKLSQHVLNPKALIKEYQLDQSQLAFTFCGLSADGKNCAPEWDTTVFSTVLQELPPPESTKTKPVTCPQCSYQFDVTVNCTNGEVEEEEEPTSNKRKFDGYPEQTIKKQNSFKTELVYYQ